MNHLFSIPLTKARAIRSHSAGYRTGAPGHRHITRPSLFKHEILIIEEGVLHIIVDSEQIAADAGTVLFCRAGCMQAGYASSSDRVRYIWMHFDADVSELSMEDGDFSQIQSGIATCISNGIAIKTATLLQHFKPRHFGEILELGHLIATPPPWLEPEKSALTTALLCRITRSFHDAHTDSADKPPQLVAHLRTYMQGMLINPQLAPLLSVRHLAEHFNRNPDYLNRQFKRHSGTTLAHEIVRFRVEEAKRRLGQGLTVKEAARLSGFANAKYLARRFKGVNGITPVEFQRGRGES